MDHHCSQIGFCVGRKWSLQIASERYGNMCIPSARPSLQRRHCCVQSSCVTARGVPPAPPHLQKFPKCLSNFLSKMLSKILSKTLSIFLPPPPQLGGTPGGPPSWGGVPPGAPPSWGVPPPPSWGVPPGAPPPQLGGYPRGHPPPQLGGTPGGAPPPVGGPPL